MYVYKVHQVMRVVDGDTVDVMIDFGCDRYGKERIRLYGINAPEIRTKDIEEKKKGIAAKDWLEGKLANCGVVYIETIKDRKGKFGRYLGKLFYYTDFAGGRIFVNEEMCQSGHAEAVSYARMRPHKVVP